MDLKKAFQVCFTAIVGLTRNHLEHKSFNPF